jgi:hypothetical protein
MSRRILLACLALVASVPAWALYDPAPDPVLGGLEGAWHGTLTYRDYSDANRIVKLPTQLFVTLGSPDELVMHYVYDDGPGKVVHSYEAVRFDFASRRVAWVSGVKERSESADRIVSDQQDGAVRHIVVESDEDGKLARHSFEFAPDRLRMRKDEIDAAGQGTFRDSYEFTRLPGWRASENESGHWTAVVTVR